MKTCIRLSIYVISGTIFLLAASSTRFTLKDKVAGKSSYCLSDLITTKESVEIIQKIDRVCSLKPAALSGGGQGWDSKAIEIKILQAGIYPFELQGNTVQVDPSVTMKDLQVSDLVDSVQWPKLRRGEIISVQMLLDTFEISVQAKFLADQKGLLKLQRGKTVFNAIRTGPNSAIVEPGELQ